jgi:hypothetical protein
MPKPLHNRWSRKGHLGEIIVVKRNLRETVVPNSLGINLEIATVPARRDDRKNVDGIIVRVNLRNGKTTSGVVSATKPRTRRTLVTFSTTSVPSVNRVGTCPTSVHNINQDNNNNKDGIRKIAQCVINQDMWVKIVRNGRTENHDEKVILHQLEELQDRDGHRRRMNKPLGDCRREIKSVL